MNPYEILGISENADEETIKKAYRKLVKQYHPDQYMDNPLSNLADDKLKEINQAYDMIKDKKVQNPDGFDDVDDEDISAMVFNVIKSALENLIEIACQCYEKDEASDKLDLKTYINALLAYVYNLMMKLALADNLYSSNDQLMLKYVLLNVLRTDADTYDNMVNTTEEETSKLASMIYARLTRVPRVITAAAKYFDSNYKDSNMVDMCIRNLKHIIFCFSFLIYDTDEREVYMREMDVDFRKMVYKAREYNVQVRRDAI